MRRAAGRGAGRALAMGRQMDRGRGRGARRQPEGCEAAEAWRDVLVGCVDGGAQDLEMQRKN